VGGYAHFSVDVGAAFEDADDGVGFGRAAADVQTGSEAGVLCHCSGVDKETMLISEFGKWFSHIFSSQFTAVKVGL
jgi:hypothetical protein